MDRTKLEHNVFRKRLSHVVGRLLAPHDEEGRR